MFELTALHGFNAVVFGPASIPGLQMWYDASNSGSLTIDGSNRVSLWNDLSGNGYHVSQGTLANQPVYSSTGVNSRPGLTFNGTSQFLMYTGTVPSLVTNTLFVAFNKVSSGSTSRNIANARNNSSSAPLQTMSFSGSTVSGAQRFVARDDASGALVDATSGDSSNGLLIWSGVRNGDTLTAYKNNVSAATATGTIGVQTFDRWIIGAGWATGTPNGFLNSPVAEIITYSSALSTTDQTTVYNYLSAKWGI